MRRWVKFGVLNTLFLTGLSLLAQGQIIGKVLTEAGRQPDVSITARNASGSVERTTVSDDNGSFRFRDLDADDYVLTFSGEGLETYVRDNVKVPDGQIVVVEVTLQPTSSLVNVLRVASASRRAERIVEAPAAVSFLSAQEVEIQAGHDQLPRLLQNKPGVEIVQNGLYDFNLNARGFNSSLNRRILTLIDGRDVSSTLLGTVEWSALAMNMGEVQNIEFVRGPGSALYGANAFNGVLNVTTRRPVDHLGAWVSGTVGEQNTSRLEARYAGEFGFGWSYRINGSWVEADTWSQSRTDPDALEYPGLEGNLEQTTVDETVTRNFIGARLDKEFLQGWVLSFELGTTTAEDQTALTGVGRFQIEKVERPFFRAGFTTNHWTVKFWRNERDTTEGMTALSLDPNSVSGNQFFEDSYNQQLEVQANYDFFDERLNLIAGGAYSEQEVDTLNPNTGVQSLMDDKRDADQQALYTQLTWSVMDNLDFIVAGRYDESSLHDSQFSPKGALVWKVNPNHTVRLTYNEAFQAPTFSEFFLRSPSSNLVPFGGIQDQIQAGLTAQGLPNLRDLGLVNWNTVPVLGIGNENLEPEEIKSFELGYKGLINEKLFLTIDLFDSKLENFVTDLLPGANPAIGEFSMAEDLSALGAASALVVGVFENTLAENIGVGLSNYTAGLVPSLGDSIAEGHPVVIVSYTNAGEVDTQGFDIGGQYYVNDNWTILGNYSWFDFDIVDQLLGDSLVPNAPETKFNVGIGYKDDKWNGTLTYRWVDDFLWSAGVYRGDVPSYEVVDLVLSYNVLDSLRFELNGNNILDDEHYEIFGGSILGRRVHFTANYRF
ncbi:TonB-dependent receptor [Sulfidibacter corallicola]|uniref:TonB-dependent receptor n=1 Tax=Sulfidibacter corallicola TaxID=2818388 RepID=A0A8A4TX08_SULCO|nr:TonB-dependent receptor [Sulfidibacter corallicola]QTD53877.1 TonB-dependent receptor [Sulfidibacter corallicola]